MGLDKGRIESIFSEAVGKPAAERLAILDHSCGNDLELRQRVDALLAAHEGAGSFLTMPVDAATVDPAASDPASFQEGPGTVIGRYKLLQQIGEGGFGVVFMAEQEFPVRRRVALKIIKLGMDTKQVVARFEAERQALAMMDHPNIARVLDGGSTETGRPYFVMQLVKGIPITTYCNENKLSTQQRLELFIAVCNAVQHAHQKGIIHRDLKPSNVLVTMHDDKPVPMVIDFGIAKATQGRLTEKTMFTEFRQMIGTPAYMSPEQAQMSGLDVDTRSDVYSLGVLLYELLTGSTPFDAKDFLSMAYGEVQRIIREVEPPRPSTRLSTLEQNTRSTIADQRRCDPRQLNRLLRGDLDWIVMKCLEKDRTRRYETVNGLAKDVQRFLAVEPVEAGPPGMRYRAGKFLRRYRKGLRVAAIVGMLLVCATVVSVWQSIRATRAQRVELVALDRAVVEKQRADDETTLVRAGSRQLQEDKRELTRQLYLSDMVLGQSAWEDNNALRLIEILNRQRPEQTGGEDLRGFEWYYWNNLIHGKLPTLKGHIDSVNCVCFSPDGRRLASGSDDKTVKLWDTATGQTILTLKGHSAAVCSVRFSPDGKLLATGSDDKTIKLWDAATGQEMLTLKGHTDFVRGLCFSADGQRLASASLDQTIKLWDAVTGQETLTLKGHAGGVRSVCFSADGKRLASASDDQTIKVWDPATGREILTLTGHEGIVWSVCFSPDGRRLVSSGWDQTIRLWDASTGQRLLTLKGFANSVLGVCFSPDGKCFASANANGTIKLWDADGQETLTLRGHGGGVRGVSFSPDGKQLASASADKTIKIWDTATDQEDVTLKGHTSDVRDICFSPYGKQLASASWDQTIKLWDAATGLETRTLKGHTGYVYGVCYSPDGKRLASAGADQTVKVWDVATGVESLSLKGHTGIVYSVRFSPDGKRLASASADTTIKLWDSVTGQQTLTLDADTGIYFNGICFSPDGTRLASTSGDHTIKIWNTVTGQKTSINTGHTNYVRSVCFSPDGQRLASSSADTTIKLWDVATGRETLTLKGHTGWVNFVCFSPDGKRLASASADNTIKLWDVSTGQATLTLKGHTNYVISVCFSPDGLRLASASGDGTNKIWDATPLPSDAGK